MAQQGAALQNYNNELVKCNTFAFVVVIALNEYKISII